MPPRFPSDIDSVNRIAAIPTILDVICVTTGLGLAAVARVTEERWVVCAVRDTIHFGLTPGSELGFNTLIYNDVRTSHSPVVIEHLREDPLYRDTPAAAQSKFQSFMSFPIILPNGTFFGMLCALDPRPLPIRRHEYLDMFKLFADLIAFHLDAQFELETSRADLQAERRTAEEREQFIAVLGHDLRNPLAAIDAGISLLQRAGLNDTASSIVSQMRATTQRMFGLIGNVLDFARGRLGGGLEIQRAPTHELQFMLEQVVTELRTANPKAKIDFEVSPLGTIYCDPGRIGQMFSNILGNALTHGTPGTGVRARAFVADDVFELSVANQGEVITPAVAENLFEPFFRASSRPNQEGLGLGLYIASEIAQAHGGEITVASSPEETRFTFRMNVHER